MSKILVVDDEKLIVKGIKFALEQDGLLVDTAYDGEEAIDKSTAEEYDLIVLDVMLPKKNGLEVCQHLRSTSRVPILMLTAKGEDMDKIMGLEYGADDYMTKPFNILELKARIRAILRRSNYSSDNKNKTSEETNIKVKDLEMNMEARRVKIKGNEINLTAKEFDILHLLITNANKVYSREVLLDKIWGYDYPGDYRTVDVHMRRLREKIEENPSNPKYLYTKWGVGYYFKD